MKGKIVFGSWEATCLLISMLGTKVILNYPRVTLEIAGTAGWIMTLYITALAIAGFLIIERLYKNHEGMDLLDIGEYAVGSIGRIITGSLVFVFMAFISFSLLRLFSEQMKTLAYERSPISFIMFFFILGILAASFFGLESFVRFQAVLVPVSIGAYTLYLFFLGPFYKFSNLLPILGNGAGDIVIKGFPRVSEYSELLFLFLIAPFIGSHENFRKVGYLSIGLSAFFLASSSFAFVSVFEYPTSLEHTLPTYDMGRIINFGRFFQRIESVFIVTWATMAFMYLGTAFYFLVYIFRKTFKLEYHWPVVFPLAILVASIALLPENIMEAVEVLVVHFRNLSGILTFGVTILLLLAARARKKSEKSRMCHNRH